MHQYCWMVLIRRKQLLRTQGWMGLNSLIGSKKSWRFAALASSPVLISSTSPLEMLFTWYIISSHYVLYSEFTYYVLYEPPMLHPTGRRAIISSVDR
ncbi:hypothetical protein LINPERPRIM_LOCUS6575 [Linum perenne]